MKKKITKKRNFNHSALEVWGAISSQSQLCDWFMDGNFSALEGKNFEFLDKPGEKWKGVFSGEVISSQPPINLAFSWCHRKLNNTTYVWWRIEERKDKTILELEHSGFKGFSDFILAFAYSWFWDSKLKKLSNYLKQSKPETVQDRSNP